MSAPAFKLEPCTPPVAAIKVFRLDDYEWWAGESLQDCIDAAGRMWGFAGEQLREAVVDAYEIEDQELDTLKLVADEQGTKHTFREALNKMIADQVRFPAFFAGQD